MNRFHAFKTRKLAAILLCAIPVSCQAIESIEWKSSKSEKVVIKRDYLLPVLDTEKAIIANILHTLHHTSYLRLSMIKGKLDRKGKKIDHIHPLRHTLCVFTDPVLRADLRAISKYSMIWKNYTDRFAERFVMEADQGNLTDWQIQDFAEKLNISASTVQDLLARRRWREFLEWLIVTVP